MRRRPVLNTFWGTAISAPSTRASEIKFTQSKVGLVTRKTPLWGLTVGAPSRTSFPVVPCSCDFCIFTRSALTAIGKPRRQLWDWGWCGVVVRPVWGERNKCPAAPSRLKPDPCCWTCGTGLTPLLPHLHSPAKRKFSFIVLIHNTCKLSHGERCHSKYPSLKVHLYV